jgi:phage gpG-like protein
MNETELFQLMIVNAIEKAIQPLKEDLKQIKALNVKLLKEQANMMQRPAASLQEEVTPMFKTIGRPNTSQANLTEGQKQQQDKYRESELNSLKAQASSFAQADGILPDIDIPLELIFGKR